MVKRGVDNLLITCGQNVNKMWINCGQIVDNFCLWISCGKPVDNFFEVVIKFTSKFPKFYWKNMYVNKITICL